MVTQDGNGGDRRPSDTNPFAQIPTQSTGNQAWQSVSNEPLSQTPPSALRPGPPGSNFNYQDVQNANPWDDDEEKAAVASSQVKPEEVPRSLVPGPVRRDTNPFKRKPTAAQVPPPMPMSEPPQPPTDGFASLQINQPESSLNPWDSAPDDKTSSRLPPITSQPTGDHESAPNPWGSNLPSTQPSSGPSSTNPTFPAMPSGRQSPAWGDADRLPKPPAPSFPDKSPERDLFMEDQHAWDDLGSTQKKTGSPQQTATIDDWNLIDHGPGQAPVPGSLSRRSTWSNFADPDEEEQKEAEKETVAIPPPPPAPAPAPAPAPVPTQTYASIASSPEFEPPPGPPPGVSAPAHSYSNTGSGPEFEPPPGPPPGASAPIPTSTEPEPPTLPPRVGGEASSRSTSRPESKNETYQIKNINWFDGVVNKMRKSPILVQNANGPCPLLALVNALSITTSPGVTSALVETLKSREQISLSFLLEAVFDELMSPQRNNPNVSLPDMGELYEFLKGLHTGMNVNPRFLPAPSLVPVDEDDVPGTFEDTRDMRLYASFSIPLIHGWLPPKNDPVFDAFGRQVSSYDDVQSLLFREEELEFKLSTTSEGLTHEEQQLYQDILTIKAWLSSTATQLTHWGLKVMSQKMQPGAVAILFRNDHFTTLYRHPQSNKLMTLVTDAGFAGHDEIVWESLADVRGELTEYFSGDFRPVGGPEAQQPPSNTPGSRRAPSTSNNAGAGSWQANNGNGRSNPPAAPADDSLSTDHEQEDRDLALALQLQEEEDERHRSEQAARRRESHLSEQFIEQQGRQGPGRGGAPQPPPRNASTSHLINVPVRGPGSQSATTTGSRNVLPQRVRSMIPPRTHRPADSGTDGPPPPAYDQAHLDEPYTPTAGHPRSTNASLSSGSVRGAAAANHPPQQSGVTNSAQGLDTSADPPLPPRPHDRNSRECTIM